MIGRYIAKKKRQETEDFPRKARPGLVPNLPKTIIVRWANSCRAIAKRHPSLFPLLYTYVSGRMCVWLGSISESHESHVALLRKLQYLSPFLWVSSLFTFRVITIPKNGHQMPCNHFAYHNLRPDLIFNPDFRRLRCRATILICLRSFTCATKAVFCVLVGKYLVFLAVEFCNCFTF